MELENSLVLKWDGEEKPACAVRNDDGGGSTVYVMRDPGLERVFGPGDHLHGVYEKVMVIYPLKPREKDDEKDNGVPDLDTKTGSLAPWVKLVIHWPSTASTTPVMIDTVPIKDKLQCEKQKATKEKITKHV